MHSLQEPPRHERNRAREADGAGASDDQPRPPGLEHERRGHHAGEAVAGLLRPAADDVELSEHVVQLRPAAEDAGPGAECGREPGGESVRVDRRRCASCPGAAPTRAARRHPRRRAPPLRGAAALRVRRGARGSAGRQRLLASAASVARTRRSRARAAPLEDAVAAQVVRELWEQLDEHRRSGIANPFERVAGVGRPNARRIAVDAASSLVPLEDPLEDRVQEQALLVALEPLARKRDRRVDELPHSRVAKRPWTTSSPASSPGTATDPSPTWNTCVPESPKSMSSSSISPRLASGTPKKQSSIVVAPVGSCTSANPPPAGPVSGPSATKAVNAAARSASTALPPSRRTRAPASAVSG